MSSVKIHEIYVILGVDTDPHSQTQFSKVFLGIVPTREDIEDFLRGEIYYSNFEVERYTLFQDEKYYKLTKGIYYKFDKTNRTFKTLE